MKSVRNPHLLLTIKKIQYFERVKFREDWVCWKLETSITENFFWLIFLGNKQRKSKDSLKFKNKGEEMLISQSCV